MSMILQPLLLYVGQVRAGVGLLNLSTAFNRRSASVFRTLMTEIVAGIGLHGEV